MIELNRVRGDVEADDFVSVDGEYRGEGECIGARAAVDDVMASAAVDGLAVTAEVDGVGARAAGDRAVDCAPATVEQICSVAQLNATIEHASVAEAFVLVASAEKGIDAP